MSESNQVATSQQTAVAASHDPSPAQILARAIDAGATPEALEKLVALQERVMAVQAERAMDDALAAFQASCPAIEHDRDTRKAGRGGSSFGFTYATLSAIERTIRPHLAENGLSFRHSFELHSDGQMACRCILRHRDGAERVAEFVGPSSDSGGSMNGLQKVGSARSYMRRYTLIDVLGLTTAEADDDGRATAPPPADTITAEQVASLQALAKKVGADIKKFCAWARVPALSAIPASQYDKAVAALEKKRGAA